MAIVSRISFLLFVAVGAIQHMPTEDVDDSLGLPNVDDMLSTADQSVADLTHKADLIQQAAAKAQAAKLTSLSTVRDEYHMKLAEVEIGNRELEGSINKTNSKIMAFELSNKAARQKLTSVQTINQALNSALGKVSEQLTSAIDFLDSAINHSNTSLNPAVQVLMQATPVQHDIASFLAEMSSDGSKSDNDDNDDEIDKVALLQFDDEGKPRRARPVSRLGRVAQGVSQAMPQAILESMTSGLASISAAQAEGETRMKAQYMATYDLLKNKQTQLTTQLAQVNQTLNGLTAEEQDLTKAKGKVDSAREDLSARFGGLQHFYEKNIAYVHEQISAADAIVARMNSKNNKA